MSEELRDVAGGPGWYVPGLIALMAGGGIYACFVGQLWLGVALVIAALVTAAVEARRRRRGGSLSDTGRATAGGSALFGLAWVVIGVTQVFAQAAIGVGMILLGLLTVAAYAPLWWRDRR